MRMKRIAAACAAVLLLTGWLGASQVNALNAYPSHPVRIVVTLPAGSAPDVRTRIIGNQLAAMLGQQVIIENRPGAGGALGVQAALSAQPDGYTLLSTVASVFTVLPAQRDKLPFDVNRDLVPIAMIANEGMVFAVSPKLGIKNLADFVALAKAQPDKLVIGTNPAGSLPHLAARLFVKLTGAPVIVAPSTGGTNDAIREILGGRGHAVIEGLPGLKPYLGNGDLTALAVMSRERVTSFPDLPTATESVPELAAIGWIGLFAPKGTSDAIVQQLATSVREAMDSPDVKRNFEQTGSPFHPVFTSEFARFIKSEQRLWWPLVKETGVK
jgi:tripartite-type tricarboxylate transporter receptor subunit TctC